MDEELKNVIDKILLVLSAFAVGICLLLYFYFLDKFKVKQGWIDYIFMSILFFVVFIYGINKMFGLKNKVTNLVSLLLLLFFAVFPVFVGFMVFYFKILPFPKRNFIYLIIGFILLPISALCFDKSSNFLERRKRSKSEH